MTFAEIVLFILFGAAVYWGLGPLRRKLEFTLFRFFQRNRKGPGPIIDITDFKNSRSSRSSHSKDKNQE